MTRFHRPPSSPPDIEGIVREAIGELLLARARRVLPRDEQLRDLGIRPSDIDLIVRETLEALRDEDRLDDDTELNVGGDDEIDTVGQLIDALKKAFADKAPATEATP